MYLHVMIGLLSAGTLHRRAQHGVAGRPFHTLPASFADLSDRQLRDIGYLRERTVAPHRHILWM